MAATQSVGKLMPRPGQGRLGLPIVVLTNAFEVVKRPEFIVHHYDVDIRPEVPTRIKRQVFDYIAKHENGFGSIAAVFDGQKNCFAPKVLGTPFTDDAHTFEIILPEDHREGSASNKKQRETRKFTAAFKKVAQINLFELGTVLGGGRMTENAFTAITALNIMIRHGPSILNLNKGPSIYPQPNAADAYRISGGLELWRGYFSSIRPAPNKLIVNIDTTVLPVIQSGNLVEVSAAHLKTAPGRLGSLSDRERIQLNRFLRGVKVIVNRNDHQTPKMRYKIKDISREGASTMSFLDENGRKFTIQQYFKQIYAVDLKGPSFPCVKVTARAWYPIELCTVAPGNRFIKKLDPEQLAEALKFTTKDPDQRKALITAGLGMLRYAQDPTCNQWGFTIPSNPMEIKARLLPPPTLIAKPGTSGKAEVLPKDGVFDMRGKHFFQPAPPVKLWGVIVFESPNKFADGQMMDALNRLSQECGSLGLMLPINPPPAIIRTGPFDTNVKDVFRRLKLSCGNMAPTLVVCFLSNNNKQYPLIKQFGDLQAGVATQCLQTAKMRKMSGAYFSNVALKVNIKLRGTNVRVDERFLPGFSTSWTMVCGADVTHPGPGSLAPSVAAVCGSWDRYASSYQAETDIQSSREEIIQNLKPMFMALLRNYYKKTGQKPTRIIFYRDGVSEGQYEQVYEQEVNALRQACRQIQDVYKPGITYMICAKRHHFRFFPKVPSQGDRSRNAKAGTLVDSEIVHPVDNDFYLQSHAGLLGTSRPTHYNCLMDDNKLGADDLQKLTYALCYTYARCNRSVSIVAPAYFAHHVATRARFHLGTAADDEEFATTLSGRGSDDISRARNEREAQVRAALKPVHKDLKDTLYFL